LGRSHFDAYMAGRVSRPWLYPYAVVEGIVSGDQLGLATLHDRQQAVLIIRIGSVCSSPFCDPPVLPFLPGEQIAGIRGE
jgi:hypothetical protein